MERSSDAPLTEVLRFLRFGVVGISALCVYWLVANGLMAISSVPLLASSIVGYVAAGMVSYFGHSYFSFRVAANHSVYGTRFLILASLGLAINVVVVQLCSAARVPALVSTAIVGFAIPVVNYVFNRLWVFGSGLDSASVSRGPR